jgi:predicted glycogen debranching enzyme
MKNMQEHSSMDTLPSLQKKLDEEWLETNGLGSYSSSTTMLCHTRKYHGLLVSSSKKLTDRTLLISKFDETLIDDSLITNLSLHYYQPGIYIPLEQDVENKFEMKINPSWHLKGNNFYLKKKLMLLNQEDTVIINYDFLRVPGKNSILELKPLLAFRDFHHLLKENKNSEFLVQHIPSGIKISNSKVEQSLFIQLNCQSELTEDAYWYKNFLLQEELNRGYDAVEDLYCPLSLKIDLNKNPEFKISLSTQEQDPESLNQKWYQEEKLRKKNYPGLTKILKSESSLFLNRLDIARKDFLVKIDDDNYSVIAGYHWFNSWGRDTFIALPGLLLKTKDKKIYINILKNYLSLQKNGLLPNMTGSSIEDSAYNSVDASLWMFWSLSKFVDEFKSREWLKEIWPILKIIYISYHDNLAPGISCDQDGLLFSGNPDDTMSWMDAMVDGKAASPRYGYLIEINALWLNATDLMNRLAKEFNDTEIEEKTERLLKILPDKLLKTFWNKDLGFFADYVVDNKQDTKLRPNQLFLLSLDCFNVSEELAESVIRKVSEKLLTPVGLRTLSPDDIDFVAKYQGDSKQRDRAYHNGTVWPWLLGVYCDSLMKYSGDKRSSKKSIKKLLLGFNNHMDKAGINSISEILDATEPFKAHGCIAQAWSVSEIRRAFLGVVGKL